MEDLPLNSNFNLSKDKKDYMISAIKEFFLKEREEEIGDLAALIILDFFTEKLAKEFYNQGVSNSYQFMYEKIEDLLGIQK
ncbi:MAG: hypothetical protein JM58_05160 [Peptococcaceae bacterium BICA1-8]|nr:MAG: hypothetical protein JM58_05160 [Peptococcaceae bacterium BICA1-8]